MNNVKAGNQNSTLRHGEGRRWLNESIIVDHGQPNNLHRIFNGDGYLRDTELKVMNFKPSGCKSTSLPNEGRKKASLKKGKCWEEV